VIDIQMYSNIFFNLQKNKLCFCYAINILCLFLKNMQVEKTKSIKVEHHTIKSTFLKREVKADCYLPVNVARPSEMALLLVNDGQDLVKMDFAAILDDLYDQDAISPLFCIGIHCGEDRKNEYGIAGIPDYKNRGAKAAAYTSFIFDELLPFIRKTYHVPSFKEKSYAGFSLGGLSALDIVWSHPHEFVKAGVFSGSLWWRDKSQDDPDFNEETDRIMHRRVKQGTYAPWLSFFFEVGTLDETADRNNNGVIDAIDDTVSLIDDLVAKGYNRNKDIRLLQLDDGKHDVPTWARAFPDFLKWGWGINSEISG
jgi:enterochelin esterase-like enzyme